MNYDLSATAVIRWWILEDKSEFKIHRLIQYLCLYTEVVLKKKQFTIFFPKVFIAISDFVKFDFIYIHVPCGTVPSGGNVTCLEGSRQRGNGIPARQLCRISKQFQSCLDPCEARTWCTKWKIKQLKIRWVLSQTLDETSVFLNCSDYLHFVWLV